MKAPLHFHVCFQAAHCLRACQSFACSFYGQTQICTHKQVWIPRHENPLSLPGILCRARKYTKQWGAMYSTAAALGEIIGNYVLRRHTDSLEHGDPRPTHPTCLDIREHRHGVHILELRQPWELLVWTMQLSCGQYTA